MTVRTAHEQLTIEPPLPNRPPRIWLALGVVMVDVLLRVLFPSIEPLCFSLPLLFTATWVASTCLDEALDEGIRFLRRVQKLFE